MKRIPVPSLRVGLVVLVVACTLPAIGVLVFNALRSYHTALTQAYRTATVATHDVEIRYNDLSTGSRNTLALMAALPAVEASPQACSTALGKLQEAMPLYANLTVVSLDGEFRCSAVPLGTGHNVAQRKWFEQVRASGQFTSAVVSRGFITQQSLLVFSGPHFDPQGRLDGVLTAAVSPQALIPSSLAAGLSPYGELSIFGGGGTLLARSPAAPAFHRTDQSRTRLFQAVRAPSGNARRLLPGLDGRPRFYLLSRVGIGDSDAALFIASGIDRSAVRRITLLPLVRDLGVVVGISLLMLLWAWWGTTFLVAQRLRPLVKTLRRISAGDHSARTDARLRRDEFTGLRRNIDALAEHLQAQTAVRKSANLARELSQRLYKDLVEQSAAGISVRHQSGEFVVVNDALCKMLGYASDELLQMRLTDVIEPTEERGHLLAPGASVQFESWMLHKDGHCVPVSVSSVRLPSGDIQSVQTDLSAQQRTERQLAEERLFEFNALTVLPGAFFVFNPKDELVRWNRGLEEATGYDTDELKRMHAADIVPPELREQRARKAVDLLAGKSAEGDTLLYTKAGARVPYYFVSRGFRWRGESCVVGMGVDVSARTRAQRELEEERLLQRQVINSLPGLFSMFSDRGRFLRWNGRLERLSGYSAAEITNLAPLHLIAPEERRRVAFRIGKAFKRGAGNFTADFICRDGRRIAHHLTMRRLDWHGRSTLVAVAVDVTEHLQAQQLLRNYVGQVEDLSRQLLNTQEEERRHMAGELHDELGQGLLAVILSLKALKQDLAPANREALEKAVNLTSVLSERVRQLSLDLRPSMLDDLGLAATLHWYLREQEALGQVKIKLHLQEPLPRFSAAIELTCFRVLQSALTNTLKHAKASRVSVWLRVEENTLHLTVQDDGCGFDVAKARERARAGKSFGLLGTEERVHLAGGRLEIHSAAGQGTRVEAVLPTAAGGKASEPLARLPSPKRALA
ncbi:MAG: PAS domain S-box protein [Gammaproteobacteria bacterium]